MFWSHSSHQLVYSSTAWRSIHPLDRAHIILVAERLKPMAYCEVSDLHDIRDFVSRGLDILVLQGVGPTRWGRSGLDRLVFPSLGYMVCNSPRILRAITAARLSQGVMSMQLQGRLLGYPRCCVEEYMQPTYDKEFTAEAIRNVTDRWAFRFALEAVGMFLDGKSFPSEFYYRMPSQTPCSVNCRSSLKLLRRWAEAIDKYDSEATEALTDGNKYMAVQLQAVAEKLRKRGFTSGAQLRRGFVHHA